VSISADSREPLSQFPTHLKPQRSRTTPTNFSSTGLPGCGQSQSQHNWWIARECICCKKIWMRNIIWQVFW